MAIIPGFSLAPPAHMVVSWMVGLVVAVMVFAVLVRIAGRSWLRSAGAWFVLLALAFTTPVTAIVVGAAVKTGLESLP